MQFASITLLALTALGSTSLAEVTAAPAATKVKRQSGSYQSGADLDPDQILQIEGDLVSVARSVLSTPAPILLAVASVLETRYNAAQFSSIRAQEAAGNIPLDELASFATAALPDVTAPFQTALPTEYIKPFHDYAAAVNCEARGVVRDDLGLPVDAVQSDCLPAATSALRAPAPSVARGVRGVEVAGGAFGLAGAVAAAALL